MYEMVAPTPPHNWVGSRATNYLVPLVDSKEDKTSRLIELVKIQIVTRREAKRVT